MSVFNNITIPELNVNSPFEIPLSVSSYRELNDALIELSHKITGAIYTDNLKKFTVSSLGYALDIYFKNLGFVFCKNNIYDYKIITDSVHHRIEIELSSDLLKFLYDNPWKEAKKNRLQTVEKLIFSSIIKLGHKVNSHSQSEDFDYITACTRCNRTFILQEEKHYEIYNFACFDNIHSYKTIYTVDALSTKRNCYPIADEFICDKLKSML